MTTFMNGLCALALALALAGCAKDKNESESLPVRTENEMSADSSKSEELLNKLEDRGLIIDESSDEPAWEKTAYSSFQKKSTAYRKATIPFLEDFSKHVGVLISKYGQPFRMTMNDGSETTKELRADVIVAFRHVQSLCDAEIAKLRSL